MKKAYLFALIALFLWGIHGPIGRYLAQNDVDMFFVFSARLWIGSLIFFLYLSIKKKLNINWFSNLRKVLIITFFGLIANTIIFHATLIYLPGTYVMVLENLAPIFVVSATFFHYGEKPSHSEINAILVSFFGILLIIHGKNEFPGLSDDYYKGIILGVLTGVTFGAYIFYSADLMRSFQNNSDEIIKFLFRIFLISAIVCSPFIFFSKSTPHTPKQWILLFELGVFQSGIAYILWNLALAHIKANTASILFFLTILFTTINEVLFLKLDLNKFLIFGSICICFAGFWISKKNHVT